MPGCQGGTNRTRTGPGSTSPRPQSLTVPPLGPTTRVGGTTHTPTGPKRRCVPVRSPRDSSPQPTGPRRVPTAPQVAVGRVGQTPPPDPAH